MIAAVILLLGVPLFFFCIYRTSHGGTFAAVAWGAVSVLTLLVVGGAILYLTVPGFFADVV